MRDKAAVLRPLVMFIVAGLIVSGLLSLLGYDLGQVLRALVTGSVGSPHALRTSVGFAIPLIVIGLGVALSFRAGFFNLGAQGQVYLGCLAATTVAIALHGLPAWLSVPAALVAGMSAGAAWSLLCGVFLLRWAASEILTTLMMNFVAAGILAWAIGGPLRDVESAGEASLSKSVAPAFRLSDESGFSITLLLMVLTICVSAWLLMTRTAFGLQVDLLGKNAVMTRWQGVAVERVTAKVFAASGAASGIAGAMLVLGPLGRLSGGMTTTIGFTAILAAVLGSLTVPGTVLASLVLGGLSAAIVYLPIATDLPASAIDVFQGSVTVLVTCSIGVGVLKRTKRIQQQAVDTSQSLTLVASGREQE
jgi:ABC-type uncharacterized transport system permease subunit